MFKLLTNNFLIRFYLPFDSATVPVAGAGAQPEAVHSPLYSVQERNILHRIRIINYYNILFHETIMYSSLVNLSTC
jgi:hypothetical protein